MQPEAKRLESEQCAVEHERIHRQRGIKILKRLKRVKPEIFQSEREVRIEHDEIAVIPIPQERIVQSGPEDQQEQEGEEPETDGIDLPRSGGRGSRIRWRRLRHVCSFHT